MKLTDDIKRMLNALAFANAGDYLTTWQKQEVLAHASATVAAPAPIALAPTPTRAQVGLYLGAELADDLMQYVIQTCVRLKHGLTVLTFTAETDAEILLAPYKPELKNAGIEMQLQILGGEPPDGLVNALRRHSEIAFLVCNETGYFGHSLINGVQRRDRIPVPVVLVAANETALKDKQARANPSHRVA